MTAGYIRPTSLLGDQTFAVPPKLWSPQKAMNVIIFVTALTVSPTSASAELTDSLEEARRGTDRGTNSGGALLEQVRADRNFADAVLEVRRRSGLTWEQLAKAFRVDRRSVHLWASGRPMSASNGEHVNRVLGVLRLVDRGDPTATKAWLHSPDSHGLLPLDLVREGRFDEIMMPTPAGILRRPMPLSVAARKLRAPSPPEALVGALHDRVHIEKGRLIAAVPLKVSKAK